MFLALIISLKRIIKLQKTFKHLKDQKPKLGQLDKSKLKIKLLQLPQ